jgi:hypothetical protein
MIHTRRDHSSDSDARGRYAAASAFGARDYPSHGTARLGVLCKLRIRYSVALAARPFFDIVEVHDLSFTTVSILNCNSIISNFSRLTSA